VTTAASIPIRLRPEDDPRVAPMRRPPRSPGLTGEGLAVLGIWAALAPIAMLFLSFVSAFVVRRGLGQGWGPMRLPALVWVNTAVLGVSSFTLELARRTSRRGASAAGWMWRTVLLGAMFLTGQLLAWRQLQMEGVTLGATAYGSFFYLLTGAHAVHLAGGLLGLLAAALWPASGLRSFSRAGAIRVSAIYWHFMTAVWAGLLVLLLIGR
jgi:cytochrome c oxidase subunit 3